MVCPKKLECGDRDQEGSTGFEQCPASAESLQGFGNVLENVKKQNERILFLRAERLERADINFVKMRIRGVDNFTGGLDTFDFAEFRKRIKKESIAAANIQNRTPTVWWLSPAKVLHDPALSHAKPPMTFIKLAVQRAEF